MEVYKTIREAIEAIEKEREKDSEEIMEDLKKLKKALENEKDVEKFFVNVLERLEIFVKDDEWLQKLGKLTAKELKTLIDLVIIIHKVGNNYLR